MLPSVSAVEASIYAVDLDREPYRARVARIDRDVRHLRRTGEAFLRDVNGQLFKFLAAIGRTINSGWLGANENDVRVGRMPSHGPDLRPVHRRIKHLPVRPVIITAIYAGLGARQQVMRVMRRDGEGPNLNFSRHRMEGDVHLSRSPMLTAVGARPDALTNRSNPHPKSLCHGSPPCRVSQNRRILSIRLYCLIS